jgi:hypothetical protein
MYRIDVIDGVATMVARDAPVAPAPEPAPFARSEDTIVIRPNKPLKVIPPEAEPEIELEVEEIDPAWGMTYVPDASAAEPEVPSKPTRDPALDVWRIGVFNDDAEVITRFYKECLETADDGETRLTQSDLAVYFNEWREEKGLPDKPKEGATFNQLLFEFLAPRYKNKNKKVFFGIRIVLSDKELRRLEEIERVLREKQEKEEMKARDEAERLNPEELMGHPPDTSSEDESSKKKNELKESFVYNHLTIHRHPLIRKYGGDLKTGAIYRLKGNKVDKLVSCHLSKGVTLSNGFDEDGKRIQQYFAPAKFIAECGRLRQETKFHTKLKIDTECEAYKTRPHVRFYPIDCVSYEYDGGLDFTGNLNRDVKSGNALVSRLKTTKQIDDYIAGIKEQYEEKHRKLQTENVKLKALNAKLEKENKQLNTPLNAGAVQLREVLLTKLADGSTVLEMLHLANKDITYGCIKDDDERSDSDDDDLIFGLPECGLPDRNEIITR